MLLFSDLSLQESLYREYKSLFPSLVSVRITRSGRSGRFAVIYLDTMAETSRLADAIRTTSNPSFSGAETHVFLAGDELVDDSK